MPSTIPPPLDKQVQSLVAGFDALQEEYQRLWNRSQILESNIDTVKTKYDSLTSQCPHMAEPLLLPDTTTDEKEPGTLNDIAVAAIPDPAQRSKILMASQLSQQIRTTGWTTSNGVVIHSGPSADKPSAPTSAMPSISESPLEQDFTVEGTPSKLDCPFASMAKRKLSSHAASVVSRYRPAGSTAETPRSSVSRINGRASSIARAALADPIKAETCGMDPQAKTQDVEPSAQGSTGVCPIRFLDQHSPEEVAAYFESHKHELPRSHEICVKRYQSNEESIRQLDAKYGNLVSMITGLGHKHTPLLPEKIGDEEEVENSDRASDEKIRKWASTVDTNAANIAAPEDETPDDEEPGDERQPRFDRPLKDVRLGESPSRPWGIQVPIHAIRRNSYTSSEAAPAVAAEALDAEVTTRQDIATEKPRGKCPFNFGAADKGSVPETQKVEPWPEPKSAPKPTFINPQPPEQTAERPAEYKTTAPQMVFTGPVFIGYSVEQAMRLLQLSQQDSGAKVQP